MERDNQRKSAIPITIRQLEAIVRVSEAVAKISLSPVVTERHVDEAIRLFNISTMNAVDSGRIEGLSRAEYNEEVGRIRDQINRRLPVGSQVSERALKDDLVRQGFANAAIDRSIAMMVGREILQYKNRRMVLFRAGI
jgi:DNA replication licensing factor MCM5